MSSKTVRAVHATLPFADKLIGKGKCRTAAESYIRCNVKSAVKAVTALRRLRLLLLLVMVRLEHVYLPHGARDLFMFLCAFAVSAVASGVTAGALAVGAMLFFRAGL